MLSIVYGSKFLFLVFVPCGKKVVNFIIMFFSTIARTTKIIVAFKYIMLL